MRAVVLAVLLAGCGPVDVELLPDGGGAGGDGGSCAAPGAPRVVAGVCAGAWAAAAHRFALCTCDPLTLSAPLRTGAFDSTGAVPGPVASVGTNGAVSGPTNLFLAGALWAGGAVTVGVQLETIGSLHAGGPFSAVGAEGSVGTDAFVDGDVAGAIEVHGALHLPATATIGAGVNAPDVVREAVSVAPPCDCAGAQALDLAGELGAAQAANDDAAIGLPPDALSAGGLATLDLPCGRYLLDAVAIASDVTLRVHGRATLAVVHDVTLGGSLNVLVDDGAELDLVVGGTLHTSGPVALGAPAAPARVRVWIAGSAPLALDGNPVLHAVVTAPRAAVSAPAGLTIDGSLLASSLASGATTTVRYDAAILASGAACGSAAVAPVE